MGKLKVTILVENTVGAPLGLLSEWGLSMLLDFGDERILFDAGEQGNLVGNAQILGHDLRLIDRVVLSHGHYDHTGGLLKFLQYRGSIPVYRLWALHGICPQEAIKISGRCLSADDLFTLSNQQENLSYEGVLNLLQDRRSIREFKAVPVEKELIEK